MGRAQALRGAAIGFSMLCVLAGGTVARADTIALAWDRTPDPTVTGYVVHVGTTPGVYATRVDVGDVETFVFAPPVAGARYYFAVSAYAGTVHGERSSAVYADSNAPPDLINPGNRTVPLGTAFWLPLDGSDPEGHALTWAGNGLPAGLVLSGDGVISGTPAAAGTTTVRVTVSDGDLTDTESFAIEVTPLTTESTDGTGETITIKPRRPSSDRLPKRDPKPARPRR